MALRRLMTRCLDTQLRLALTYGYVAYAFVNYIITDVSS